MQARFSLSSGMDSLRCQIARFFDLLEKNPWKGGLLLFALIGLIVYSSMPARELTFDNSYIIGDDTRLRQFSMESFWLILRNDYWWPSLASSLYRPLTTLSFWFEYSFLGYAERPFGYQLTNLFLHVGNVLLVVALARRFGVGRKCAFGIGAIFCVHPIATEVVANIVGRSDLFACGAVIGGLLCYFRGLNEETPARRLSWFFACGACGLAGVLAKESAVALPALVAWHGMCRWGELHEPSLRRLWLSDAWRSAFCLLPCALLVLLLRSRFSNMPGLADHPFIDNPLMPEDFTSWQLSAFGVWGMQLKALVLPLSLSSDYSFNAIPIARWSPPNMTFWWGVGTLGIFAAGIATLFACARRWPEAVFLFGAYAIAMLPTSNVLIRIGSIRAERFHYLPSVFLWIGATIVLYDMGRRILRRYPIEAAVLMRRAKVVLAAWCACLAVLTHLRCYDWQSNLTLWQSAVDNAPGSVKAQAAVSNERVRLNNDPDSVRAALTRIESALTHYVEQKVDPADWPLVLFSDYGAFSTTLFDELSKQPGQEDEAKWHLENGLKWLRKGLEYEHAMRVRWSSRWAGGNLEKAPMLELLHKNFAMALQRSGETQAAIDEISVLIDKRLFKSDLRELRARWLLDMNKWEEAADELMLLSVMIRESTSFVTVLGETLKKIDPSSKPMLRDASGNWRLDIEDAMVRRFLERASRRYMALLNEVGDDFGLERFVRTARHVYGLELGEVVNVGIK